MKLGRIGSSADRTDWSGVYSPSENVEKIQKADQLENYVWRRNYAFNSPFFRLSRPSITYGDNDTKIYIADSSNTTNAEIRQYNLSTPGDPSTATDSGNSLALANGTEFEYLNTAFNSDGTRMYISFYTGSTTIYQPPEQYNLSTAWDVSTAVPKVKKFSVASQETNPFGVYVKPDGTKMYVVGITGDDINEYDLSTAYDVSTASYNQNFSVSGQETNPRGVEFKPDGTKMYVVGTTGDDINEYDLSTAWDVSTASFNQNFSVSAQDTNPYTVRFKPDGTKMFVSGFTGNDINEYSLTTAWDVSTASFVQNFSTGDSDQTSVAFSDDGTKMYTVGLTLDYIKEWDLTTAWSLTTVTLNQNSGEIYINPSSIHLVDDNKLYIVSNTYDQVVGYTLNTDKDIRSIDGILQGDAEMSGSNYDILGGVAISSDGTKFFVLDREGRDRLTEFTLPTADELTGATRTGNFIQIEPGTNESQPTALHFSYDGKKVYIAGGDATRAVYLYNLSTDWDITTATLNKQRLNLYSNPSTTSANYDTLTEAENYGSGPIADVEGLAVSKDGTNILISTDNSYSEYKLPV
jgi:6-phosphogluconolactonase (cycloisomerase 2 family)